MTSLATNGRTSMRGLQRTKVRLQTTHTPATAVPERAGLLVSIQPRYANAILDGSKTVELRRRPPKSHPPIAVIYGSGANRSVVGSARIQAIHTATPADIWRAFGAYAGVSRSEFDEYFAGCTHASALELAEPRRAEQALPLAELRAFGLEPPQSWRYVDADQVKALTDFLHPRTSTADSAEATIPAMDRAARTARPVAARVLRCMPIGLRVQARHFNAISMDSLNLELPVARCYFSPGSWIRRSEDL